MDLDTQEDRFSAAITGFVDYTPEQQYLFHSWLQKVARIYETFGFTPIHLRPFEKVLALQGDGETQKQIFEIHRFDTKQTTHLALPFDHTVPFALWVAEHAGHKQDLSFPYKRYDLGLSYRGERAKMGRFRAFIQADVDIVGRNLSIAADAECIAALYSGLEALEIGKFQIRINHIAIVKSILKKHALAEKFHPAVLRAIDKLDKLSPEEVLKEIEKIEEYPLSSAATKNLLSCFLTQYPLDEIAHKAEYGEDAISGIESLKELLSILQMMGIEGSNFVFVPGMVRGLAYYTGVVFETLWEGKEQYGSVAGGGRYQNLVGDFATNLSDIEGVGGSLGLTRIFDIYCKTGSTLPKRTTFATILVGARTPELMPLAYAWSKELRKQGHLVDLYAGSPKVKQILSHANVLGTPYTALVMDHNSFVLKDMQAQTQKDFGSLIDACQAL